MCINKEASGSSQELKPSTVAVISELKNAHDSTVEHYGEPSTIVIISDRARRHQGSRSVSRKLPWHHFRRGADPTTTIDKLERVEAFTQPQTMDNHSHCRSLSSTRNGTRQPMPPVAPLRKRHDMDTPSLNPSTLGTTAATTPPGAAAKN